LPVILLEIDASDDSVNRTYIYADGQILAQHDGNTADERYFYLHDRLGSVREVIDTNAEVVNTYSYDPFGETFATEAHATIINPFRFAGQYFDSVIDEYYLRARQYNPYIGRFTSRDPACGDFKEPMTLHKYLYSMNNPINRWDPTGRLSEPVRQTRNFILNTIYGISMYYAMLDAGLSAANDYWDVLDVAISVNEWREAWFDPQNLRQNDYIVNWAEWYVHQQISRLTNAILEGVDKAIEILQNGCDWDGLSDCFIGLVGDELWSMVGQAAIIAFGETACWLCKATLIIPDPAPAIDEAILCSLCGGYNIWKYAKGTAVVKAAELFKAAVDIGGCVMDYCGAGS
jgi:RHS repeat-associated protein